MPGANDLHSIFKERTFFDYDDERFTVQIVVVSQLFGRPIQPSFIAVGAEAFLAALSELSNGASFIIGIILDRRKTKEDN